MSTPVWTTTAGRLASADQGSSYSLQFEANSSDSTAISYSVISGSLPSGLTLSSTGLLSGVPARVEKDTRYKFVVRATAGSQITDRSFTIDITANSEPTFTTNSGLLQLDDSTAVGLYWVLDGAEINFQVVATDLDTRSGHQLIYEISSGELPPGVTLSKTGLISGIVKLTDSDFSSTAILSQQFYFNVRVFDGTTYQTQQNYIHVYSANYWSISNTDITIDQTLISGVALTVDFSNKRRPIFTTPSDLGTFRHDNDIVIKIDILDADPLENAITYSLQSGSLPPGTTLNANTGEIAGSLARQTAVEVDYNFKIRANREVQTGQNVFTDQDFKLKVIGEIDIGISFTTATNVGTLEQDKPSTLAIEATAENTNRVLSYTISGGSLPPGISLTEQGNLIGTIDKDNFTDSTRTFSFKVTVSDQYQENAATKDFTLSVDIPFTTKEYGSMTGNSTSLIDQNIFYNVAQDTGINSADYIYRPEDSNFGVKKTPEILLLAGLESQTLTTLQAQMEQSHATKRLYFGDIKTAVAKENGVIKYEVVYIEMKDELVNADGDAISSAVSIYSDSTVYPNAIENMRNRMKSLGHNEFPYLPLWMRTAQTDTGAPLGFVLAVPICYCKPTFGALVKKRIEDKKLIFRNIDFVINEYRINKSKVDFSSNVFVGDGTTTTFELNEIIHEQDILVKEGNNIVLTGEGFTASGFQGHLDPTADGTVRSADHEVGIELTHNTSTNKTTVVFLKGAPSNGTIITVDRLHDKYLKFRKNKGNLNGQ